MQLLARVEGIDHAQPLDIPPPEFDVHIPLMSLPGVFQTEFDTIPAEVPYLSVDAGVRWSVGGASWGRDDHSQQRPFRIGIAWQGNPNHKGDHHRSFPLAKLMPVAEVPGVRLISLQKGPGTDQLATLAGKFPVLDLESRLRQRQRIAHEPGGDHQESRPGDRLRLRNGPSGWGPGARTFVGLQVFTDWRWFWDRDDSPWYPTMRLFRQTRFNNWDDVFERMAREIGQ